ncbi:MAG: hypothetical protein ACE5G1_13885, partial [bacterium]
MAISDIFLIGLDNNLDIKYASAATNKDIINAIIIDRSLSSLTGAKDSFSSISDKRTQSKSQSNFSF